VARGWPTIQWCCRGIVRFTDLSFSLFQIKVRSKGSTHPENKKEGVSEGVGLCIALANFVTIRHIAIGTMETFSTDRMRPMAYNAEIAQLAT
jgi:hypothetical protein